MDMSVFLAIVKAVFFQFFYQNKRSYISLDVFKWFKLLVFKLHFRNLYLGLFMVFQLNTVIHSEGLNLKCLWWCDWPTCRLLVESVRAGLIWLRFFKSFTVFTVGLAGEYSVRVNQEPGDQDSDAHGESLGSEPGTRAHDWNRRD